MQVSSPRRLAARRPFAIAASLPRTPLSLAVSAVLASTLATPLARAQGGDELETIIVTATRRAESVQSIPINIAAFDADLLQSREITDLADLGRNVPGLYVVDQGKRSANNIVVRGLNLNPFQSSEFLGNTGGEIVSTYVGDIPMYVDLALNDVDRVEVLLGPQGTLYGAGTLGGAIRYIPKRPQFDSPSVSVRASSFGLSHGDDLGARAGATFNVPFTDNLAFRASVDYYNDPGFIDTPFLVRESGVSDPEPDFSDPAAVAANLYRRNDVNGEETKSGRIGLRWQPGDKVDANFTYFYQDMDVGGRTQNHVDAFGTGRYESATRYPEPNDRKNQLLSAEIVADLGFAELTSATGYSRYKELGQRDQTDLLITLEYSYEAFPAFSAFTREDEDDHTLSQELRLVSKSGGKINWIAGLFYLNQKTDGLSQEFTPHYDEYLGGPLRPDSLEYYSVLKEDLTEQALFGELGFDITDRWQVTVGARYYDYTFDTLSDATTPLFLTFVGDIGPTEIPIDLQAEGQKDSGTLFKLNTSLQFTNTVMGYVTISEGYRIGASNGIAPCPNPLPPNQIICALPNEAQYFPDKTTNYEVGFRSQWLDRKLTFNASVYYIDWQDPQLSSATANGAQPITKNGDGAESKGVELTLNAQATDALSLGFSYSHSSAKLSSDAPDLLRVFIPPGFGPSNPAVYTAGLKGDRLPGSPQDQGTFYLAYDWQLNSKWDMTLNYAMSTIGNVITTTGQRAGGEKLPGFSVHNASLDFKGGAWGFAIYAQNLLDKYAITGTRSRRAFIQTVADENGDPVRVRSYATEMLRPREVGVRFTYDFNMGQ
jgi:iron complex outermembrane recepter protein